MPQNAILSVSGTALSPRERDFLREADPWGIILFGRNVQSPAQLRALTAELRLALGRDAPILIDQEGGRVQRLTPPHWRRWRSARAEADRALSAEPRRHGIADPNLPSWTEMPIPDGAGPGADPGADGAAERATEAKGTLDAGGGALPGGPRFLESLPVASLARAERIFHLRGMLIGAELRAAGIDVNCSPCADVARPQTHAFLVDRCLSEDPAIVSALALATAEGLLAGGCLPVAKHLPGHGGATMDSHAELPRVHDDRGSLIARDFMPFRALAHLPMAMTGHIVYPAWDDVAPATQSAQMIAVIRHEIGFDGLLVTDDLGMEALQGPLNQRAGAALAAGCDLVLYCKGDMAEAQQVMQACSPLSGLARIRAAAALAARPPVRALDIAALEAEFSRLTLEG